MGCGSLRGTVWTPVLTDLPTATVFVTRILITVTTVEDRFSSVWTWRNIVSCLVLLTFGPVLARGQSYVGNVDKVVDSDTIHLLRQTGQIVRIELYGIDAPERGQPFGDAAARAVRGAVYRMEVRARSEASDKDGRHFFEVRVDDRVLNELLLRKGLAWWDREGAPHNDAYRRLEQRARAAGRGLWAQSTPVPPWLWREENSP